MTHDEAVLLLTDLAAGRLAPAVRQDVQEHLEGCPECASLAATHDMLAGRHTPVDDLVELSLHSDQMEQARRMRLQAHLEVCEACGAEAQSVRRAERKAVAAFTGGNRRGGVSVLMSAVATAILGLGLSAYLGLYRIPRLESTLDRLQVVPPRRIETAPHPNEPGPLVRIQYLPSTRRGPGSDPAVTLDPGQPYQYLAIEVPAFKGRGDLTIEVAADGGSPVWSRTVPADELRRLTTGTPEITLAVPTRSLHAGRFLVRLHSASDANAGPLIDSAFVVRTAP
jgi:hypothetical protein